MSMKVDLTTEHRRRLVARLLVRGIGESLGLRGLSLALADPHLPEAERSVNPDGEPWSLATLSRDVAAIQEAWRIECLPSVVEERRKQLARIDEMLKTALGKPSAVWAGEARQLLALQARMLGTDSDAARVHDLLSQQMHLAVGRLEAEFAQEPALLQRIVTALVGSEQQLVRALPTSTAAEA